MVKYTTKQWDDKFSAKPSQITLVDQEKKNGKELNNVWNVMKRFVDHPANEELPAVHLVVKGFAVCVPCRKVVNYGTATSTLAKHVHSKKCKVDPTVKKNDHEPLEELFYFTIGESDYLHTQFFPWLIAEFFDEYF